MKEDAPRRTCSLRELFKAPRWFVRADCPWRMLPNDLPPWTAVEQQAKRRMRAGCFEAMAHDLRMIMRLLQEKAEQSTAAILDGLPWLAFTSLLLGCLFKMLASSA